MVPAIAEAASHRSTMTRARPCEEARTAATAPSAVMRSRRGVGTGTLGLTRNRDAGKHTFDDAVWRGAVDFGFGLEQQTMTQDRE